MIIPNNFQISKNWWIQFPYNLRLITKIRFYAAFGAGGVIYLTSLIFNNIGLSATDIGLGFTISAIIGTVIVLLNSVRILRPIQLLNISLFNPSSLKTGNSKNFDNSKNLIKPFFF